MSTGLTKTLAIFYQRVSTLWLSTLIGRSIQGKIILPYLLLLLLIGIFGTYLTTHLIATTFYERMINSLIATGQATNDSLVQTEQLQLADLRAIVSTQGVSSSVITRDSTKLAHLVLPLAVNRKMEVVELLDNHGIELLGIRQNDEPGQDYQLKTGERFGDLSLVQQVQSLATQHSPILSDKSSAIVITQQGSFLFSAGVIYTETTGKPVGTILTGMKVPTLLEQLKASTFSEVTLYTPTGEVIGSTFDGFVPNAHRQLRVSPELYQLLQSRTNQARIQSLQLNGRAYTMLYTPLELHSKTVGLFSVGLPTHFIFTAMTNLIVEVIVLILCGMIAIALVGHFVAARISRPIRHLVKVSQAVSSGALEERSLIRGTDEIGILGEAFDTMTATLAHHIQQLRKQYVNALRSLAIAIDVKDHYTRDHCDRVGNWCLAIARELGVSKSDQEAIFTAALLHDIGKIGIPDTILHKVGPLTPAELEVIQHHPLYGYDILHPVGLPDLALSGVAEHHENYNGTGYPYQLSGQDISLSGRILAIVDAYDAMTSDRPYRKGMAPAIAISLLRHESGAQFDPAIVEVFVAILYVDMQLTEALVVPTITVGEGALFMPVATRNKLKVISTTRKLL